MKRGNGNSRPAIPLYALVRFIGVACLLAPAAHAQSAAPTDHFVGGVIHPPAKIDPKMTVAPPATVRMPTPMVRPPAASGTVVVPK